MRPLDLNLASRPFRNDTLLALFYIVMGAVLLTWAVMAPLRYSRLVERKDHLRSELQEMRVGTQSFEQESREYEAKIKTLPLEEMRERSTFAREVLEHRNFSWTTLFNHLEEPGVVRFDVIQELERPERFMLVEVYRTDEDPAKHKETAHYQTWRDTVAEMMAEPRRATKYRHHFPDLAGWETRSS